MCSRISKVFRTRDYSVVPEADVFLGTDSEADSQREPESPAEAQAADGHAAAEPAEVPNRRTRDRYKAMVQKLHVLIQGMPLLLRCCAWPASGISAAQCARSCKCRQATERLP